MSVLSEKKPSSKGSVITFFSYKGGVGRSMALVNIAVLLAREGNKVLTVDWDLEAPGLEQYFKSTKNCDLSGSEEKMPGVTDLLLEKDRKNGVTWRDCLIRAIFEGGELDIITAGRRDSEYQRNLRDLDWEVLYTDGSIGEFLDDFREDIKEEYDFILIDSRTGITDIGDVCTVIMPDLLVTLFTSNYQNIY